MGACVAPFINSDAMLISGHLKHQLDTRGTVLAIDE